MTRLNFVILFSVLFFSPVKAQEMIVVNPNRVCAAIVGIPYASDNFSDAEWNKFLKCLKFLKQFNGLN